MKPEQIVQLVSRVVAVYLLVGFVFPETTWLFVPREPIGPLLVKIFLDGAVAAILWIYPSVLSNGILPKDNKNETVSPVTLEAVQTLCFALLGTYFSIHAVVPVLHEAVNEGFSNGKFSWDRFWFEGVVQFFIGLWLIFGGRGFMGFITRLRNTPRQSPIE